VSAVASARASAPAELDAGLRPRARISVKRAAVAAAGLAVALDIGWYGYGWWTNGRFIESTDDAYVGGDVTTIAPHVAGFVSDVAVVDNEHVRAGQLLMRLDARDFQAACDRAQATVLARRAALQGLRAAYEEQRATIRDRDADLRAAAARLAFAHVEGARYAALALTPAGSRQDAERTRATDQEAAASVSGAAAAVEAARRHLDVLAAQVAEAQASVGVAEADLRTAGLDLGYTQIRSPIDGYVGNRAARAGAYVSQASYLLSVIPAHGLWVDANFKEDQLARMRRGQTADVTADVAPGVVFHGRVDSLAPGTGAVFSVIPPENATGNFTKIVQRVPVRIELDTGDGTLSRLRPGLSTTVSVDARTGG
jgi:membrane fusion protein (multidrug efflux system)